MNSEQPLCIIPGCKNSKNRSFRRGMCNAHSLRMQRRGTVELKYDRTLIPIEGEVWLPIRGHERYQISNMGRVLSDNGVLTPNWAPKDKTYCVHLGVGVCVRIHKIVADHFIPNPFGEKKIIFKNGDRRDQRADNLAWWSSTKPRPSDVFVHDVADQIAMYRKFLVAIIRYKMTFYPEMPIDMDEEDIAHETFVKAIFALQRGMFSEGNLKSWLVTIAINTMKSLTPNIRKRNRAIRAIQEGSDGEEYDITDQRQYQEWTRALNNVLAA
jgi:hypothetical protein